MDMDIANCCQVVVIHNKSNCVYYQGRALEQCGLSKLLLITILTNQLIVVVFVPDECLNDCKLLIKTGD